MKNRIYFEPYEYSIIDEKGEVHTFLLIAICSYGMVIRLTNYHKYSGKKRNSKYIYSVDNDSIRRICNFLNYALIQKKKLYNVHCVAEIPFEAAKNYIIEYAKSSKKGKYPSRQSVEKERNAICHFMYNLGSQRNDINEHYYVRPYALKGKNDLFGERTKRDIQWDYEIVANYMGDEDSDLIRDIPQKAIPIILETIRYEAPDLFLAVLLQLTAGLREGEVVNVRRANSIYYGGIKYQKVNKKFTSFSLDLNKNYLLRSDGIITGSIKGKRTQEVYPIFLQVVQEAYEKHLELIKVDQIEEEAPLFVTKCINSKTGKRMALTKEAYCKRIMNIMYKHVLPVLLKSDDVELRTYALLLNEHRWGLHAFRHWFTVQLVLNGEDINSIASWRGDKSLRSAYVYLQNKGELMRKYRQANENVANWVLTQISGEEFYGKSL